MSENCCFLFLFLLSVTKSCVSLSFWFFIINIKHLEKKIRIYHLYDWYRFVTKRQIKSAKKTRFETQIRILIGNHSSPVRTPCTYWDRNTKINYKINWNVILSVTNPTDLQYYSTLHVSRMKIKLPIALFSSLIVNIEVLIFLET